MEASQVTVRPDSEDDWEAVELHPDEVTNQLLTQVHTEVSVKTDLKAYFCQAIESSMSTRTRNSKT